MKPWKAIYIKRTLKKKVGFRLAYWENRRNVLHNFPTDYFTILGPNPPCIHVSLLNKIRLSPDFEAPKICVMFGQITFFFKFICIGKSPFPSGSFGASKKHNIQP